MTPPSTSAQPGLTGEVLNKLLLAAQAEGKLDRLALVPDMDIEVDPETNVVRRIKAVHSIAIAPNLPQFPPPKGDTDSLVGWYDGKSGRILLLGTPPTSSVDPNDPTRVREGSHRPAVLNTHSLRRVLRFAKTTYAYDAEGLVLGKEMRCHADEILGVIRANPEPDMRLAAIDARALQAVGVADCGAALAASRAVGDARVAQETRTKRRARRAVRYPHRTKAISGPESDPSVVVAGGEEKARTDAQSRNARVFLLQRVDELRCSHRRVDSVVAKYMEEIAWGRSCSQRRLASDHDIPSSTLSKACRREMGCVRARLGQAGSSDP